MADIISGDVADFGSENQKQLDLFTLVDGPRSEVVNGKPTLMPFSNSVGSIDFIPRFKRGFESVVPRENFEGNAVIENHYTAGKNKLICRVQPAIIKRKVDGVVKECFAWPGDREELIEKVLFLLASNKGLVPIRTPGGIRYGIYFTLYEVRKQLKKINKTRSLEIIKESLLVMRESRTSIYQRVDGKEVSMSHNIFVDAALEVTGVGKNRDRCFITFSDYVIDEILNLNYRQYHFSSINSHDTPLARFVHHYLLTTWTNAVTGGLKTIYVTELFDKFGKKNLSMSVKRRDLRAALQILVDKGWFLDVPYSKQGILANGERDYSYSLTATDAFVSEVIKANAKRKGLREIKAKISEDPDYELPLPFKTLD